MITNSKKISNPSMLGVYRPSAYPHRDIKSLTIAPTSRPHSAARVTAAQ